MRVYTYSEARQRLASVLETAAREGGVRIRRRDGTLFVLRPEAGPGSAFDVPGPDLGVGRDEVVAIVREGRRRARTSSR